MREDKTNVPFGMKAIRKLWKQCPYTGRTLYASSYGRKYWVEIVPDRYCEPFYG